MTRTGFLRGCLAMAAIVTGGCIGPGPGPAFAPGERDRLLREFATTRSYTVGQPGHISITPDADAVLFLRAPQAGKPQDLFSFAVATGELKTLANTESLLGGRSETLTVEEKARRERMRETAAGITGYQLSKDGRYVLIPLSGGAFVLDRTTGATTGLKGVESATDLRFSPDARYVSYVRAHDLYVYDRTADRIIPVTTGGSELQPNGEAEFVAQEEMDRRTGYWWSPDSKWVAYENYDATGVERNYIADAASAYTAPQGWFYPRAGKPNVVARLAVSAATGGTPVWVQWDAQRFPYLATVRWAENAPLVILVQARDQREQVLLRVDPATGRTTELLRETDAAWINLNQDMPHWLKDGRRFLWSSEQDGEWRLTLHDADGRRLALLNPGNSFRLRDVVHVDETRSIVVLSGSDRAPESHLYELPLSGGGEAKRLTTRPGLHGRIYSDDGRLYLERFEDLESNTDWHVRRADGTQAGTLPSITPAATIRPKIEITRVGPHEEFDAVIVRPRNFRAGARYPVIVDVYGGPGEGVVHASWRECVLRQWYADHGFIVVATDNRGVRRRGREWERVIRGNFGEIPLEDQVTALRALTRRCPEMDLTRVGIKGWSFGGYMSALAACKRGDVFAAAAAGAPVIDWTEYDTHYTERYLGMPQENAEGYKSSSVLTYADQLHRPLLILHGTADDNVYFVNSLKLTDALTRAGKTFEFVPLPGYTHMVPDTEMRSTVEKRIADFFVRTLIDQRGAS